MSRRTFAILVFVVVTAAAGGVALYVSTPAATPRSPVAARVGNTGITTRDVDVRVSELVPMFSFHANIAPEKMRALRRTALDELTLEELILQDARSLGLEPDQKDVESQLATIRKRFANEGEFEAALASSSLSKRDFRRQLERAVLVRDARKAHMPADPTEEEVRAYYDENPGKLLRPEQIRIVELLVKVDPAGGPSAAAPAEKKARGLAARARQGEDLGTLARKHSDDDWRVKDGDLGWVHRGRLDPDLESAVFAAPLGEVRVVRSLSGFHVFRVAGRQPATKLAFEEARPAITERIRAQRRDAAEAGWYTRLRSSARVEILDPDLKDVTPLELPRLNVPSRKAMGGGIAPVRSH